MRFRLLPEVTAAETREAATPILEHLMNRGGHIAIDTETTGLDNYRDRVLFFSMATESARYCFPADLLYFFDPLFRRSDVTWRFVNAKYDMHLLANHGIQLLGTKWDASVMDTLDDDTRPHGLKEMAWFLYQAQWGDFKDLFLNPKTVAETLGLDKKAFTAFKKLGVGDKLLYVYDENPYLVEDYASCDAYFTYQLCDDLYTRLANTPLPTAEMLGFEGYNSLADYYSIIEAPMTDCLWDQERVGLPVDLEYAKSIALPLMKGIARKEKELQKLAGRKLNPNSTDQLREFLYGDGKHNLGLKAVKHTKSVDESGKAKASSDEKALKILLDRVTPNGTAHHFLDALLEYRSLNKLYGTYVKNLNDYIGPDGRLHCRLNQNGARTGRLSSSNPNIQNIPAGDEFKIRGIFCAEPGWELLDLDYPQIEFRIAAVMADANPMMEAMRQGLDIHCSNAARMYGHKNELATYENILTAKKLADANEAIEAWMKPLLGYRKGAKTVGLAVLYGEGVRAMARALKISIDEAADIQSEFFNSNPEIAALVDFYVDYAYETETTFTTLGRIRRLHRINNPYSRGIQAAEERQAPNTGIQGTGAEMIKLAMLRIWSSKDFRSLGGRLLGPVHDELLGDSPEDTAADTLQCMAELMANPFQWGPIKYTYPVPITPDAQRGKRWSELH